MGTDRQLPPPLALSKPAKLLHFAIILKPFENILAKGPAIFYIESK